MSPYIINAFCGNHVFCGLLQGGACRFFFLYMGAVARRKSHSCAVWRRTTALIVVIALLLALSKEWFDPACRDRNTLCGVPLASIVVYGTGGGWIGIKIVPLAPNRCLFWFLLWWLLCCIEISFSFFPFLSLFEM